MPQYDSPTGELPVQPEVNSKSTYIFVKWLDVRDRTVAVYDFI
jgi:hypothetical protein